MLQLEDEHIRSGFFYPSLWKQRRNFIQNMLRRFQIETVLDYGCGEASVLSFLISPEITKLAGIDLDIEVLQEAIDRCMPTQTDYKWQRSRPLSIDIFHGSIGLIDDRLKGYQAIVCSEVIEHVFPDTLHSFLDNTLGTYQPEILIVTTPNGEYNINFPNLKYGTEESMFRHDDHKFEWTRDEFETWCRKGAKKYNYNIEFHGIGLLHGKYNELDNGHCTQACIFIKSDTTTPVKHQSHGTPHAHLQHIEFPYQKDNGPLTDKQIMDEILYYIEALCRSEYFAHDANNKPNIVEETEFNSIDFEKMDWKNFNISEYVFAEDEITTLPQPKCTPSPLCIPVSSLWEIARVQTLCQEQSTLTHFLSLLDEKDYKRDGAQLIVYKVFNLETDADSVSSFDSDRT